MTVREWLNGLLATYRNEAAHRDVDYVPLTMAPQEAAAVYAVLRATPETLTEIMDTEVKLHGES